MIGGPRETDFYANTLNVCRNNKHFLGLSDLYLEQILTAPKKNDSLSASLMEGVANDREENGCGEKARAGACQ